MKREELFDRVNLITALPQAVFSLYLDATIRDLRFRYTDKYTVTQTELGLYDAFENALLYGVLHQATGKQEYLSLYESHAQKAYLYVWKQRQKMKAKEESQDVWLTVK